MIGTITHDLLEVDHTSKVIKVFCLGLVLHRSQEKPISLPTYQAHPLLGFSFQLRHQQQLQQTPLYYPALP